MHGAETRVARAALRVELNGLFELRLRRLELLQAGERVALEHQGADVLVPRLQRGVGPRLRLFETAGDEQVLACRELDLRVVREEVCRPDVLPERSGGV